MLAHSSIVFQYTAVCETCTDFVFILRKPDVKRKKAGNYRDNTGVVQVLVESRARVGYSGMDWRPLNCDFYAQIRILPTTPLVKAFVCWAECLVLMKG